MKVDVTGRAHAAHSVLGCGNRGLHIDAQCQCNSGPAQQDFIACLVQRQRRGHAIAHYLEHSAPAWQPELADHERVQILLARIGPLQREDQAIDIALLHTRIARRLKHQAKQDLMLQRVDVLRVRRLVPPHRDGARADDRDALVLVHCLVSTTRACSETSVPTEAPVLVASMVEPMHGECQIRDFSQMDTPHSRRVIS
ncbi:hypothetical protein D3C72_1349210 [compost metagenome]